MSENNNSSIRLAPGAWWTLAVLTLVAVLDWADRALIAATVEPIRAEFDLSDGQIGFLMGAAFVVTRVLLGLPIGRWADRGNRRNIVAASIAAWSIGTIAFGMARNFTHLLIGRLAIGAGTAGSISPSLSMIADLFPLKRRGLAMGVWNAGTTAGWSIGVAVGALITQFYGWRTTMWAFGLFGIAVALLVLFGTREPERRSAAGRLERHAAMPRISDVLRFLWGQRSVVHVFVGMALVMAIDMMASFWAMSFFVRSHGLEISVAGQLIGLVWLTSIVGSMLGGYLADRLGGRDFRWHGWLVSLACLATAVTTALTYTADALILALIFLGTNSFVFAATYPAQTNIPIGLFPARMRALGYAIYTVILYSGYAIGPAYIGTLSDWLEPRFGEESLRYAMLAMIPFMLWAALHLWLAAKHLERDYVRADRAS